MRSNQWLWAIAIMTVSLPSAGWAVRGDARGSQSRGGVNGSSNNLNYSDPSQRKTQNTDREDRKKKEAEAAKKKAEEDKRNKERQERREKYEKERSDRDNAGKKDNSKENAAKMAAVAAKLKAAGAGKGGKAAPAAAVDPTTREVTEVMLDSVKTQSVDFSVEEASKKPGVILLNAPKNPPSERTRAGDYGIGGAL